MILDHIARAQRMGLDTSIWVLGPQFAQDGLQGPLPAAGNG
jgi:hypothetical protein